MIIKPLGYQPKYKYPPRYLHQLDGYPEANPVFIAVDIDSFDQIKFLHGICLLCDQPRAAYDFAFCYQREVWVLYSKNKYYADAVHMARAIQLSGALQVLTLFIATSRRTSHESTIQRY